MLNIFLFYKRPVFLEKEDKENEDETVTTSILESGTPVNKSCNLDGTAGNLEDRTITRKLNLVDLAGSEAVGSMDAIQGIRTQGISINKGNPFDVTGCLSVYLCFVCP